MKPILRIGSGEAILDTPFKRFVTYSVRKFALSIAGTFQMKMPLPKPIFVKKAGQCWDAYGRKNGPTRKDMQTMRVEDE